MRRSGEARPLAPAFTVERITTADDADDLCAIEDIARASFTSGSFSAAEEIGRPWSRLWIARLAERRAEPPVGFLIAWHVADELHVLNIATDPSMRRRGVALRSCATAPVIVTIS